MSEIIDLNDSTPTAPAGFQNVAWQKGSQSGIDPTTGQPIFPVSANIPTTTPPLVIGQVLNTGVTGTNVGAMLAAPRAGSISKCVAVTKTSDGVVPLQFDIKKNGTSVFTGTLPTISAATASGTVSTFTGLTSVPLTVNAGDVFSINIIQGSSTWMATIQLET